MPTRYNTTPLEFEGFDRRRLSATELDFSSCPFVVLRAPSWIILLPLCGCPSRIIFMKFHN